MDKIVNLLIHWGGSWKMKNIATPRVVQDYIGGQEGKLEKIDVDRISWLDLLSDVQTLCDSSAGSVMSLHYIDWSGSLVLINSDQSVLNMMGEMVNGEVGHVFVEWHQVTPLDIIEPPKHSSHSESVYVPSDDEVGDDLEFDDEEDSDDEEYFGYESGDNHSSESEYASTFHDVESGRHDCGVGDDTFDDVYVGEDETVGEDKYAGDGKLQLAIGMVFNTVKAYREHLRLYAIQNHFEYVLIKNDKKRVTAECFSEACSWRCHASVLNDNISFKVKTITDTHICQSRVQNKNRMARSTFVIGHVVDKMRTRGTGYTPRLIQLDIHDAFQIKISYWVVWFSRMRAIEILHGRFDDSYGMIPKLCNEIVKSFPGNKARWAVESDRSFKSLFLCFATSAYSWRVACRPIIGLDGCFLKGKMGGVLLSTTGLDGNRGLYPIAFFFCKTENQESWTMFLTELRDLLYDDERKLTFYSDRQKGLLNAVEEIFPNSLHRFCLRHIYANFKRKYSGKELKEVLFKAAYTYEFGVWRDRMQELKELNVEAWEYMNKIDPVHWSRSHFDTSSHCDHVTNNFSESFNKMIKELRDLPITLFVERLHVMIIEMINRRRMKGTDMVGPLTSSMAKEVDNKKYYTKHLRTFDINENMIMVQHHERRWEVNLVAHTCTCREWQVSGVPCVHAIVVLQERRMSIPENCSVYFSLQTFKNLYKENISMIPDKLNWENSNIVVKPPSYHARRGRPKKNRIKEPGEVRVACNDSRATTKCTTCNGFGHNKKTCPTTGGSKAKGRTKRAKKRITTTQEQPQAQVGGHGGGQSSRQGSKQKRPRTQSTQGTTESQPTQTGSLHFGNLVGSQPSFTQSSQQRTGRGFEWWFGL